MAESTLSLTLTDFRNEVAYYLGQGRDYSVLSTDEKAIIDSIVNEGLRQFYFPAFIEGVEDHNWSFLSPMATLSTTSAQETDDLPDNYGYGITNFTYAENSERRTVPVIDEVQIRSLYAMNDQDGPPRYAAIRPKTSDGSDGQRSEVLWYPKPDDTYVMAFRYHLIPDALVESTNEYPLGSALHSQTILQSCIAAAELRDDEQGIQWERFLERLRASIKMDRKAVVATSSPWPVETPSNILDITYNELLRDIGAYMGYGFDSSAWTHEQYNLVDEIIQVGMRQYLSPPPVNVYGRMIEQHEWHFLMKKAEFTLAADTATYDLPADFGAIEGPMTYQPDEQKGHEILIVPDSMLRQYASRSYNSNGIPVMAAISPKAHTNAAVQAFSIEFWPTPDAAYDLDYQYRVKTARLSAANPYPPGGHEYAELIRLSCMAAAEERKGEGTGVYYTRFIERVAAAIQKDRKAWTPEWFGYNADLTESDHSRVKTPVRYVGTPSPEAASDIGDAYTVIGLMLGGDVDAIFRVNASDYFAVSAQSPATRAVNIAAGYAWIDGALVEELAAVSTVALSPPAAPNDRIDLVQITAGGVTVKQGTPAGSPVAPAPDASAIPLATIYFRSDDPGSPTLVIKDTDDSTNHYIASDERVYL